MSRFFGLPWCAFLLSESLNVVPLGSPCGLRSRDTLHAGHRDFLIVMDGCDCQAIQTDPALSSLMQVSSDVHHFAKNRSIVLQPHLKEGVPVALAAAAHRVRNLFGPEFPLVSVLGLVGTPIIIAALFVVFLAKAPPERNSNGGRGCPCYPWPPYERSWDAREAPPERNSNSGRGCPCCPWPPYERDVSRRSIYDDKARNNSNPAGKSSAKHMTYSPRVATPSVVDQSEEVRECVEPVPRPVPKELLEQMCVNYEKEGVILSMHGPKLKPQAQHEELPILRGQQRFLDVLVAEADGDHKGIVIQTINHPEVVITQLDTSRAFEAPLDGSLPSVTLWNPWHQGEAFHIVVEQSCGQNFSVIPVIEGIRQPPWYRVAIGGLTFDFYNDHNKMDAKMQINAKPGDEDACVKYVFTVADMVDASLIMASGIAILKLRDVWDSRYPRR